MPLIPCNEIPQVALELQMKFTNCEVLDADDLDTLVDLILSIGDCITAGTYVQNNIVKLLEFTTPSVDSVETRVNNSADFTINEDEIYIIKSTVIKEINGENNNVVETYILKPGKGAYGATGVVTNNNDYIFLSEDQSITILDIIKTNITSIGNGTSIYKGYNNVTSKHEIRSIKSDSLNVEIDENDNVLVNLLEVGAGLSPFYVNNLYTGQVEEGTVSRPYKTIQNAKTALIGSGTIESPEFLDKTIIIQKGTPYNYAGDFNVNRTSFLLEEGAVVTCSNEWLCDLNQLATNSVVIRIILSPNSSLNFSKNGIRNFGNGLSNTTSPIQNKYVVITGSGSFRSTYLGQDVNDLPYVMFHIKGLNGGESHLNILDQVKLTSNNQPILLAEGGSFIGISDVDIKVPNAGGTQVSPNLVPINILNSRNISISNSSISGYGRKFSDSSVFEDKVKLINIGNNVTTDNSIDSLNGNNIKIDNTDINTQVIDLIEISDSQPNVRIENCFSTLNVACSNNIVKYTGSEATLTSLIYNKNNFSTGSIDSDIDLTKNNTVSVENIIKGQINRTLRKFDDRPTGETAGLSMGDIFINTNGGNIDDTTHFLDIII